MKLNGNVRRARANGMVVIVPTSRELQIDLDGARALRRYGLQYKIMEVNGLTKGWRERILPSKTPGHVHVVITMPRPMRLLERAALAAFLGDDIKRGAFNYVRIKKRSRLPIALFRKTK